MPSRVLRLVCCLLVPASLGTVLARHPQVRPITDPDARVWLNEVQSHHPGSLDAHAVTIANWPWKRFSAVVGQIGREAEPEAIL